MLIDNIKVFDEFIKGTSGVWYSSSDFNERLGDADILFLQAIPTRVAGTEPKLTVATQHSGDSENWVDAGPTAIDDETLDEDEALAGGSALLARFVRLKITLGGTDPECRLVLHASLRALGIGIAASEAR
jgi:hypothetical protein